MIDPDFMQRCEQLSGKVYESDFKPFDKSENWLKRHPEIRRESQKRYLQTKKGKRASKRRSKNRINNMRKAKEGTSWIELRKIRKFYENCPEGMTVDHIIPVGKGGLHRLDNLQYLSFIENCKKGCKIL